MFVSAGNPVLSVPGAELSDALDELDLLVCIDLYRNETAEHADYLLPAADMLERSDYPVAWANLQPTPHVQWTDAVVVPTGERRVEWEIFCDLAVACGASPIGPTATNVLPRLNAVLARLPGGRRFTPDHLLALLLRWGRRTTLAELRANPSGLPLPATEPGSFLGVRVPSPDGLVDLAPRELLIDLGRLEASADELADPPPGTLVLIGRRQRRSHNSWMHNNPGIRQPAGNTALVHPKDAGALGITDGGRVAVRGNGRAVELPVAITEDVAPGVVSVPHGWGHDGDGLRRAGGHAGVNVNEVIGGGQAWMEPVSGQSIMVGHRVEVAPVDDREL
ncbi:MAG: molybdopterin dinucleotide binding domain-containing protein [Acidimicrobiales bacterium]